MANSSATRVGGLYNGGETEEGFAIEEMLSGEMFRERPAWTWKYLRQIEQEWKRIWFTDQPSHMTYDRIHGGLE